jgi:Protein of unknown function (DUF2637)
MLKTSSAASPAAEPNRSPTISSPHQTPSIADPGVQAADVWLRRFQAAVVGSMAVVAGAVGAIAFFTSFEAIKAYAEHSRGIAAEHAWAVPLLVDSFIVMATGADLWLSAARSRRWWEVSWPKLLLAGAAAVSFVLNVAHAQAGDWSARGVAAIPPAALVLSVELLVLIVRRAAMARIARLSAPAAIAAEATTVARGDQTTPAMVAATGDHPALPATTATWRRAARSRDHDRQASGDQPATATAPPQATTGDHASGGATYQRVRDLYEGGITVAAEIARELGVSASYAQRTLRRVKADLARRPSAPSAGPGRTTTPERTDQATSDHERDREQTAARSHDHPTTPDHRATSRDEATRDGDGRTTTSHDRHLALVTSDHDRGEVER